MWCDHASSYATPLIRSNSIRLFEKTHIRFPLALSEAATKSNVKNSQQTVLSGEGRKRVKCDEGCDHYRSDFTPIIVLRFQI